MTSDTSPMTDEQALTLRHGDAAAQARLADMASRDPGLAARLAEWDRQDAALHALYAPVAQEPLPEALRQALHGADGPVAAAPRAAVWPIAAAVALLAFGFGGGWLASRLTAPLPPSLAQTALGSYATYVVETAHPVEVPASDAAHLVTWLSERIGQPFHLPDLTADGFQLVGGRLLPGLGAETGGPAGLLMYQDALGRRLTLYLTRVEGTQTQLEFAQAPGAQTFWWVDGGLGCALVGDLPRDTLRHLAIRAYHDLDET